MFPIRFYFIRLNEYSRLCSDVTDLPDAILLVRVVSPWQWKGEKTAYSPFFQRSVSKNPGKYAGEYFRWQFGKISRLFSGNANR